MPRPRAKTPPCEEAGPLQGLGALLRAQGLEAAAPAAAPAPAPAAPRPGRVVLRIERKGRGGKTATLLCHHGLPPADAEALARRLRKALGCGAGVEGEAIAVQGDQREAAARLLEAEGWRITRG